jgi:hypothetical protein
MFNVIMRTFMKHFINLTLKYLIQGLLLLRYKGNIQIDTDYKFINVLRIQDV